MTTTAQVALLIQKHTELKTYWEANRQWFEVLKPSEQAKIDQCVADMAALTTQVNDAGVLAKTANLSDLLDTAAARTNLGALHLGSNLGDVPDKAAARTALGTLHTGANLSDVSDTALARGNLGFNEAGVAVGFTLRKAATGWETVNPAAVTTTYLAPQRFGITSVTSTAGTVTLDLGASNDFTVTLAENTTVGPPAGFTAAVVGQSGRILVRQDGTGGHTLGWDAAFLFGDDRTLPEMISTANGISVYDYWVVSTTEIIVTSAQDFA